MPKLREIFDLLEQVHQGDFVLKLTDGLEAPAETQRPMAGAKSGTSGW